MRVPERVLARVWSRIDVRNPDECWPSSWSLGSHGYTQIGWKDDKTVATTAHRVAWISWYGPIPDGMTVDHKCRNRVCCNPLHLRVLPNRENAADNGNARKTHCPHGHEYTDANTRRDYRGFRYCRAC